MPSSKIPLPVKKTYSDACLYSVPKQSPLDRMRNDFERRRAEEKQRIRAVSLAQVDQRKRRLLNNGDSRLINNNFVGYTDFFNEPVIQCKGSFVTDVDHAQKPRPFTESAHPTGQLFRPEKRSAGRDRSHPLAAIDSQLLDNKRVTDVKLREEEASHTKQGKLLNNTYTVKKPPVGNQSLPYLVQPNRVHELSTLAELPPVRHRRLRSADNNYSVLPIKQKGHDSDENSDLPYGCMENVTENRSTCTNSRASSAKKTNEHSSHKHIREPEGNREYAEHQTSARITSSPTAHSAPVYSRGNTPVSCAAVNNKNGSNRTADSPTSVEHLLIVPVPPAGSRPSLDNGSYNAHLRRRQVMKQTILKQQRMKMLNGRITDTDDWQGVTAEINSECTALEENRVHHVQQDSDIQEDVSFTAPSDLDPGAGASDSFSGSVNTSQALEMPAAKSDNVQFVQCDMCNRSFTADRLEKHQKVCAKEPRRRKVFDPVKMRVQGTDFASYVNSEHKQQAPPSKKSNWRQQHENFVQNLQYARKVSEIERQGGKVTDLPPPPAAVNPDYVKCPTCGRNFSESAAERHIPWCKETHQRAAHARSKPRKH